MWFLVAEAAIPLSPESYRIARSEASPNPRKRPILLPMTEITARLSTALAEIADCRFGVGPEQSRIVLDHRIEVTESDGDVVT